MGEMLVALAGQVQSSWSRSSRMSMPLSMSPTPYKSVVAAGDDDFARTRTTESHYTTTTTSNTAGLVRPSLYEKEKHQDVTGRLDSQPPLKTPLPSTNVEPNTSPDVRPGTKIRHPPLASPTASKLLCLPLEVRLQIYRWVLLLDITDRSSASTPNKAASTTNDSVSAVSVSNTLFDCMPPYFFDSPQHFGPGDGIMFMSMFAGNAHQNPLHFRRVTNKEEKKDKEEKDDEKEDDLLPAYRPVGRALPLGLLSSCRQVYAEARSLAFETSEFVFVRLFSSGLSTAHAFVVIGSKTFPGTIGGDHPRLQPWQRDSLRNIRLELDVSVADMGWTGPERDPKYVGKKEGEDEKGDGPKIMDSAKWLALCDGLSNGLHSMRLLLNITEERYQGGGEEDEEEETEEAAESAAESADESAAERAAERAARSILVQGLVRLAALRQVEIELVWILRGRFRSRTANMTPTATQANITWCAAVETAINEVRRRNMKHTSSTHHPVWAKVVCVERIYDEERKKQEQ